MQNSVITQCPNCEERFKVTPGQLKLAHGKVRCGECLTIFDALACAEDKPDMAPTYPEIDRRKPQAPQQPQQSQQPLDLNPPPPPPISFPVAEPASTPIPAPLPMPEPEPKPAPVPKPAQVATPEREPTPAPEPESSPATAQLQAQAPEAPTPFSSGLTAERDEPPVRSKAKTAARYQAPLLDLKPEPVVMHISEDESDDPYNVTGWLLGTLVAIALLLFQVFWFERQTLADYPELRPVYYLMCDHVDCSLRGPKAVNQIATRQLIIRPNPYFTGALNVSVVLENQTAFNQPFPLLRLMFNDTQGRHIAGRDFKPEEYLNTQRIDPRFMTPGQPFELSLELLSPATGTLGYQLELLPYH